VDYLSVHHVFCGVELIFKMLDEDWIIGGNRHLASESTKDVPAESMAPMAMPRDAEATEAIHRWYVLLKMGY
jgi:hypothetical protein